MEKTGQTVPEQVLSMDRHRCHGLWSRRTRWISRRMFWCFWHTSREIEIEGKGSV